MIVVRRVGRCQNTTALVASFLSRFSHCYNVLTHTDSHNFECHCSSSSVHWALLLCHWQTFGYITCLCPVFRAVMFRILPLRPLLISFRWSSLCYAVFESKGSEEREFPLRGTPFGSLHLSQLKGSAEKVNYKPCRGDYEKIEMPAKENQGWEYSA